MTCDESAVLASCNHMHRIIVSPLSADSRDRPSRRVKCGTCTWERSATERRDVPLASGWNVKQRQEKIHLIQQKAETEGAPGVQGVSAER